MPPPDSNRPRRIPALDGLRAVAVALVVLFHLRAPRMAPGFIGVDVFFVLSGYLITSGLATQLIDTGRLDLVRFWARRLQRLFPAAGLLLLAVLGYGWFVARPYLRPGIGGDVTASALYFANWHFIGQGSYFSLEARASPLHHMWSLSLEEQFYLLWPLLLLGVVATRRALRLSRNWILPMATGLCLLLIGVSCLVSIWLLHHPGQPDRAYMGTDSKAFEPLVGALLALLLAQRRPGRLLRRWAGPLGWLGLVAGIAYIPYAPMRIYYQEGGALLFSGAVAALLLALVEAPRFRPRVLLALPPLVYLGRISYGIYLWHWPVAVALGAHQAFHPLRAVLVVVVTVALAATSHHLVEQPILAGRVPGWRGPGATLRTACAMTIAITCIAAPMGGSFTSPLATALLPQPERSRDTVMLVGDSVPYYLAPDLDRAGRARGVRVVDATRRGCPGLAIAIQTGPGDQLGARCAEAADAQARRVSEANPGVVLWWSRYEVVDRREGTGLLDVDDPRFWRAQQESLRTSIDRLSSRGALVVIVLTERHSVGLRTRCQPGSCSPVLDRMLNHDEYRQHWNRLVTAEARRDARIRTISVDDVLCLGSRPGTTGGHVNLCGDRLPSGGFGRPDGTHVNLDGFGTHVAGVLLDRAIAVA